MTAIRSTESRTVLLLARTVPALALALLLVLPAAARAGPGLTWSAAIPVDRHAVGIGMTGVACPAVTQCTAIDQQGNELTFNPQAPVNAATLHVSGAIPTSVACPSATQCTAVDSGGNEATFNPQTAQLIASATVDSQGVPISIDCPSAVQCTAVDLSGNEASFNPTTGVAIGNKSPDQIDSSQALVAVDCISTTTCTAIDTSGAKVTFNPAQPTSSPAPVPVEGGVQNSSAGPVALACQASSANCLLVDSGGSAVLFGSSINSTRTVDASGTPTALSCASDSACVAVDASGNEVSISVGTSGLTTGGVASIDPGRVLTGVSCPSSGQCTAVDSSGAEVTFNPAQPPSSPAPISVDGSTRFTALACASTGQCTAMDARGLEATFAPGGGAALGAVAVDPGTTGIYSLACAGAGQCTAVDNDGKEVTFNPSSPGGAAPVLLDPGHSLFAVSCPAPQQCTAVDDRGAEISFNPQAPAMPNPVTLDPGHGLPGVSCPSATQCTAIDDAGRELTFNPQNPAAPSPSAIDPIPDAAIACPDVSECVAVGATGNEVAFNPEAASPLKAWTATVGPGDQLTAVACRTDHDCVADGPNGAVFEGDPWGAAVWAPQTLASGTATAGIACPSSTQCVAADAPGDSFVGLGGPFPPIPVGASAPAISGTAIERRHLAETHGDWSQSPTSYSYQWLRCTAKGQGCIPITSATGQGYVLTAADVGHELRVQEWAANISGVAAAPVTSAETAIVRPLVPVHATGAALSLRGLHPRFRVTVAAFAGEPPIRTITVSLGSGFGFARKARHGLSITTTSKKTRFSAVIRRATLEVKLRTPSARIRIGTGGGLLVAPRRLISRHHSDPAVKTQIHLTVVERGGAKTRLALKLPA